MTQTTYPESIKIEDIQVGHRYVEVVPGFEPNWTVQSVEEFPSQGEFWGPDGWYTATMVAVTYADGRRIAHEKGTKIAVECDIFEGVAS